MKRFMYLCVGVCALMVTLLLGVQIFGHEASAADDGAPVLRAQSIVLSDANHTEEFIITVQDGQVLMGSENLALVLADSSLIVESKSGGPTFALTVTPTRAKIALHGEDGQSMSMIMASTVSAFAIAKAGKPLVIIQASEESGKSGLFLRSALGQSYLEAFVENDSLLSMRAVDRNGNPRFMLGTTKGGSPSLTFFDAAQMPRMALGAWRGFTAESSLLLFDETGRKETSLP